MSSFERLDGWRRPDAFEPTGGGQSTGFTPRDGDPAAPAADATEPDDEETRIRRAYEDGLAAGRSERPHAQEEILRLAAQSLNEAARELVAVRDGYLAANRRGVVDLALHISGAVLGAELSGDRERLASRIGLALAELGDAEPLRLHLAPQDRAAIEAQAASELARLVREAPLDVSSDPELQPGEFRLLGTSAEADARLDTLLARVRERIDEACNARGEA